MSDTEKQSKTSDTLNKGDTRGSFAERVKLNPRLRGLKPFQKGKSGNPAGKPKGVVTIGQYYRDWLEADVNLQAVTKQLLKHKPDVILHYAYGKPVETNINLNSDQTSPEAIADALARLRAASKKVDAIIPPDQTKTL